MWVSGVFSVILTTISSMPPFTGEQTEVQRGKVIRPKSQLIREELGLGFEVCLKGKLLQQFWTWGSPAVVRMWKQPAFQKCSWPRYLFMAKAFCLPVHLWKRPREKGVFGQRSRRPSPFWKQTLHPFVLTKQANLVLTVSVFKGVGVETGRGRRGGQLRLDPGRLSGVDGTLSRF